MPAYTLRRFTGGYDRNCTYLVTGPAGESRFLVDAAVPYRQLARFLERGLSHLLLTHGHLDHTAYLQEYLTRHTDLTIVGHPATLAGIAGQHKLPVLDGSRLVIQAEAITVLHTPGHSADSLCYLMGGVLFSGDTLFIGRTGRTIGADSDTSQLYRSVYRKLLTLPPETRIYPGHDYGWAPVLTIRENRRCSPLLQAGGESDFRQRMQAYEIQRQSSTSNKETRI